MFAWALASFFSICIGCNLGGTLHWGPLEPQLPGPEERSRIWAGSLRAGEPAQLSICPHRAWPALNHRGCVANSDLYVGYLGFMAEEQKFLSSGSAPRCCSSQCDADHHKSQARQQDPDKQTQASSHGGIHRGLGGSWSMLHWPCRCPALAPANLTSGLGEQV